MPLTKVELAAGPLVRRTILITQAHVDRMAAIEAASGFDTSDLIDAALAYMFASADADDEAENDMATLPESAAVH